MTTYTITTEQGTELVREVPAARTTRTAQQLANHLQAPVYVYSDDAQADGPAYREVTPNHTRMK